MSTTLAFVSAAIATGTASAAAAPSTTSNRAPPQGGIIEGASPVKYDPSNPIILFIIQTSLIVIVCHALHWPLAKIRQPRVIAEVVGGIILGPSVMGRVPGFRAVIFPKELLPSLNLVAKLGLVLYLFLIGLETDIRFLAHNWRVATSFAFAGLALPFGVGCALAWGIYTAFHDDSGVHPIPFTTYMLFIGIDIAITAFPVLCRILTELKLLDTSVGVITLSAGVANDVVDAVVSDALPELMFQPIAHIPLGWVLLALCVALVNAGNGLAALWILFCCVGFMLLLLLVIKPALIWVLRRTGSIENDPSQSIISLILLIALASAFFTGIIGVHPIFGGFMAGLILPRENRFNIRVTEKLEDLIGAIFLPLYFTLSGLNTNLGLLDTGTAWGYVFATTFVALLTKILGASVAARLNGLVWRESFTIGVLMSCKGLVEFIVLLSLLLSRYLSHRESLAPAGFVLKSFPRSISSETEVRRRLTTSTQNIGLQANILSTRTFTIFVVMALLTTFATTPIVSVLYPPSYQSKVEAWRRGELDWESGATIPSSETGDSDQNKSATAERIGKILAYLRLDSMPALLNLLSLLGGLDGNAERSPLASKAKDGLIDAERSERPVWVHGMRLLHLTDRDSSVMTVSQVAEYSRHDPVVNTFRTVGQLHNLAISGEVAIMPEARFVEALVRKAANMSSDFLLLPWSETGGMGDSPILSSATLDDKMSSTYGSFAKSVLESNDHNIGIFFSRTDDTDMEGHAKLPKLNQSFSLGISADDLPMAPSPIKPYHIFMAYFGGEDDVLALHLVLQLCERSKATAAIVRAATSTTHASSSSIPSDLFDSAQSRLAADIATRVEFSTAPGVTTADDLIQLVPETRPHTSEAKAPILVVLGRGSGADMAPGKACKDVREDVMNCLGTVAGYLVAGGVKADLIVQTKKWTEAS